MNLISRTAHGVLDYAVGIVLVLVPWMLGFTDKMKATNMKARNGFFTLVAMLILSACDSQKDARDPQTGTPIGTRSAEAGTTTAPGGTITGPGGQGSGPSDTTTTRPPLR